MGFYNIEDTREPEDRTPVGHCAECETELYNGDEVVDINGAWYCNGCKTDLAFKTADKSHFREFLENHDLLDTFVSWLFEPNTKILEEELEDTYERLRKASKMPRWGAFVRVEKIRT